MQTGDIEVEVSEIKLLGKSQNVLPFEINNAPNTREELRLKYRYLDLCNPATHDIITLRVKMLKLMTKLM